MSHRTRFSLVDAELAEQLAIQFGTPVFVLDEAGIHHRLEQLQRDASSFYEHSQIAISYKTNPTRALLADLHHSASYAEVVSGDEYQIALSLNVPSSKIIFNGPVKTDAELELAINGTSILHCDHDDEIARVEHIAKKLDKVVPIGIRLYFPGENNWDRFGLEATRDKLCSASQAICRINESSGLRLRGLHAHIGTNVRDLDLFRRFALTFSEYLEWATNEFGIALDWIDIGGGLAGIAPLVSENRFQPHEQPCLRKYSQAVIEPLLPWLNRSERRPRLFLEPGRTLFNAFGGILVTVIGRRPVDKDGVTSVILDAGITSLHFAHKYNLPVHVCDPRGPLKMTRLLGPTCMEQDVVSRPILLPALQPGDRLIVYGTGCYSMAMANSFIRFRVGTIGWQANDRFRWLRLPETIEHSSRLDVMPK